MFFIHVFYSLAVWLKLPCSVRSVTIVRVQTYTQRRLVCWHNAFILHRNCFCLVFIHMFPVGRQNLFLYWQDLSEIQEMIRMVFEVINSCITHAVHTNAHLVHVMLCHRVEFERLREMEQFKHILQVLLLLYITVV